MGVGKKLRLFYFTILLTSVCLLDSLSLFPSSQVFHLRRLKSIEIESIVRLLKLPDAELLEKESRRLEGLPEEIKESEFAAMLIREALMRKLLSLIGVEALLAKEDL